MIDTCHILCCARWLVACQAASLEPLSFQTCNDAELSGAVRFYTIVSGVHLQWGS